MSLMSLYVAYVTVSFHLMSCILSCSPEDNNMFDKTDPAQAIQTILFKFYALEVFRISFLLNVSVNRAV